MVGGAGLLRRDQKGCWGRKRLRNAELRHGPAGSSVYAWSDCRLTGNKLKVSLTCTFVTFWKQFVLKLKFLCINFLHLVCRRGQVFVSFRCIRIKIWPSHALFVWVYQGSFWFDLTFALFQNRNQSEDNLRAIELCHNLKNQLLPWFFQLFSLKRFSANSFCAFWSAVATALKLRVKSFYW